MRCIYAPLIFLSLTCNALHADVVVIVSKKNPINTLNADQVRELFPGETKTINGNLLLPLDQTVGENSRNYFYTEIIKKSEAKLKAYRSRLIFTGKGQAPLVIGNDADMQHMISNNPNLIGYIDTSKLTSSVKVVYRP